MRLRFEQLALPLTLLAASCGDDSFQVQRAPEFPHTAGARVSVFGVYKDGRLAPEAWDPLRVHAASLFAAPLCEPGYPDIVQASGTPVLQAIDDYSRANGVTDELLDRLAPAAKGDFILLVTETGRPGPHQDTSGSPASPSVSAPGMRSGGRRGPPPTAGGQSWRQASDAAAFEAVGLLFSVHAHKTVGAVRMTYSGVSFDEAMRSFFAREATELPGATCEGWKADALHLLPGDIRKLDTE